MALRQVLFDLQIQGTTMSEPRIDLSAECPHCGKKIRILLSKRGAKSLLKLIKTAKYDDVFIEMALAKDEEL